MSNNYIAGFEPVKEALYESIEATIALSYSYMKKNNIPYDFSGQDELSINLKILISLKDKLNIIQDKNEMIILRNKIIISFLKVINNINAIIGLEDRSYGRK